MHLYNLGFIYFILPAFTLLYYITPSKLKNTMLVLLSIVFYVQLEPILILLMLGSTTIDYLLSKLMKHFDNDNSARRIVLLVVIFKNIGLAVWFTTASMLQMDFITIPLGLFVYLFTSLGYIIDVYKGDCMYEDHFVRFLLFNILFFKIYIGPIVSYNHFSKQLKNRTHTIDKFTNGIMLFIVGLAKKVILADPLLKIAEQLQYTNYSQVSTLSAWTLIVAYALGLYLYLWSFSDMALGLGNVFGFELPKNFDTPFRSDSIDGFYNKFNITVTKYIKKHVFIQLGADQNGALSTVFNVMLSSMLIGMWYSLDLNGVMWGAYFGFFILIEQYLLKRFVAYIPTFFTRVASCFAIILSFLLLSNIGDGYIAVYLNAMLPFKPHILLSDSIKDILFSNWLVFIIAITISLINFPWIISFLKEKSPKMMLFLSVLTSGALLYLTTSLLI